MLKEITEEQARELIKQNPTEQVAIFNSITEKWYDIRGLTMEQVGSELMRMADIGVFDK
jgi:hypothetical protein